MRLQPSNYLHPVCNNCITFNVYLNGILYVPEFVYHKDVFDSKSSSKLGNPVAKKNMHSIKIRGRLLNDDRLIAMHTPRDTLTVDEVDMLHKLIQMYNHTNSKIFIGNYTEDSFDKIPTYSYEYIKRVLVREDICDIINMHTCDPMIKNFIKRSYL